MKLMLTEAEVKEAVVAYVKAKRNIDVTPDNVKVETRYEGQYEDQTMVFEGISIDIG